MNGCFAASRRGTRGVLATVSLVTFDGLRWLPGCLDSVRRQTTAEFELLVLDNASTDGSAEWLRDQAAAEPRMRLEESPRNVGFAAGHNRNIRAAAGEFVLLLNQDIELDADFLASALAAFEARPEVAAVQGRLRQLAGPGRRLETLDSAGLQMRRDRRVVSRGQGQRDGPPYDVAGPVWGVDGPAPVYRLSALRDARLPRTGGGWEVLDEDFFAYKEDVDLAWRLRLLGWEAWYEAAALGWHARTAAGPTGEGWRDIVRRNRATSPAIRALSWRNQRLMQVKNDPLGDVARALPWILRREVLAAAYIVLADPQRLSALPALLRRLPGALRKRRVLQRRRRGRTGSGVDSAAKGTLDELCG